MGELATHAVLIRGINVGGKNPVPMPALRDALAERGYEGVRTYIQSGNVVLRSRGRTPSQITADAEAVLAERWGVDTVVVTVPGRTLEQVVANAPAGFGDDTKAFKHDVVFLRDGVEARELLALIRLRDGVDEAWAGERVLYFRRVSALLTTSWMNRIVSMPQYADMTIRNWRTTTTLAAMAAEVSAEGGAAS